MVLTRSQSKTNFKKINNPYFNKKINKQKVINQKVIKQKVIKQKVIKVKDMRVNTFEIKQNTNIKENTVTDLENLCQAKKMEEFNQNILYHDERIKYFKLYIGPLNWTILLIDCEFRSNKINQFWPSGLSVPQ